MALGIYSLDALIACKTRTDQSLLPNDSVLSQLAPRPSTRQVGKMGVNRKTPIPHPSPPPTGCKEHRQGGACAHEFYFSCFSELRGGSGGSIWDSVSSGSSPSASESSGGDLGSSGGDLGSSGGDLGSSGRDLGSSEGGEEGASLEPPSQAPKADPTEARRILDDVESPAAPEEETKGECRNLQWPVAPTPLHV